METVDIVIEKIQSSKNIEERKDWLKKLEAHLQDFESGDMKKFRNTAIYNCYKHYFDFYSRQPFV